MSSLEREIYMADITRYKFWFALLYIKWFATSYLI